MKKLFVSIVFLVLMLSTTSCKKSGYKEEVSQNPEEKIENAFDFKTSFTKIFENAKAYTLEVAEAMPEEDYNYKVSDSVRTFGEQMAHIGMSSQFILVKLINGEELPESESTEKEIGASKENTIALLNNSFDTIIANLNSMDEVTLNETFVLFFLPEKPEYTKQEGFMFLRDHITHHRGQAIIYLRAKGHKAPQYRGF